MKVKDLVGLPDEIVISQPTVSRLLKKKRRISTPGCSKKYRTLFSLSCSICRKTFESTNKLAKTCSRSCAGESKRISSARQPIDSKLLEKVMLNTDEVAARYHFTRATLRGWRIWGGGPPCYRIGKWALYKIEEVEEWILKHRAQPTRPGQRPARPAFKKPPKPPKPPRELEFNENLSLRVSTDFLEALRAAAAREGLRPTTFARRILMIALRQRTREIVETINQNSSERLLRKPSGSDEARAIADAVYELGLVKPGEVGHGSE